MANTETEFAEYLSMESFFNAETLSQQNFHQQQAAAAAGHNPDYSFAPLEPSAYSYEAMDHSHSHQQHHNSQDKFDFHNNNNNVQYFYENNNSVQVAQSPAVGGHPTEFYVSFLINIKSNALWK